MNGLVVQGGQCFHHLLSNIVQLPTSSSNHQFPTWRFLLWMRQIYIKWPINGYWSDTVYLNRELHCSHTWYSPRIVKGSLKYCDNDETGLHILGFHMVCKTISVSYADETSLYMHASMPTSTLSVLHQLQNMLRHPHVVKNRSSLVVHFISNSWLLQTPLLASHHNHSCLKMLWLWTLPKANQTASLLCPFLASPP